MSKDALSFSEAFNRSGYVAIYMKRQKLAFEASPDFRELSRLAAGVPSSVLRLRSWYTGPIRDMQRANAAHGKAGSAGLSRAPLGTLHFTIAKILCKASVHAREHDHARPRGPQSRANTCAQASIHTPVHTRCAGKRLRVLSTTGCICRIA